MISNKNIDLFFHDLEIIIRFGYTYGKELEYISIVNMSRDGNANVPLKT